MKAYDIIQINAELKSDNVQYRNKNLAIANRARVSCAHNTHNTSSAFIGRFTP